MWLIFMLYVICKCAKFLSLSVIEKITLDGKMLLIDFYNARTCESFMVFNTCFVTNTYSILLIKLYIYIYIKYYLINAL